MTIEELIADKMKLAEDKAAGRVSQRARGRSPIAKPSNAICGNCQNLTYYGPMEVSLEWGTCEEYKETGTLRCKPDTVATECQFWRPRSVNRMRDEMNYAREVSNRLRSTFARNPGRNVDAIKMEKVARPRSLDADYGKDARLALASLGIGVVRTSLSEALDDDMIDDDTSEESEDE